MKLSEDTIERFKLRDNLCIVVEETLKKIANISENNGGQKYTIHSEREHDFTEIFLFEKILKHKADQNKKIITCALIPPLFYPILSSRLKKQGYLIELDNRTLLDSSNEELIKELIKRGLSLNEFIETFSKKTS